MATILAANTGNWSATGTWTGGVVPVAGDIVVANGKTITMDTLNITVAELRNDTTGGAVAGGAFNLVNSSNIIANIYVGNTTNHCVSWSGSAGQTATVTGSFFGGPNTGSAVYCNGGNLTVGGGSVATGGTVTTNSSCGVQFASSGTFLIGTANNPVNIYGGTTTQSGGPGVLCNTANSTITIYATTISGNTSGASPALYLTGTNQIVNITATSIGSLNGTAHGILAGGPSANHTYTISGNIIGPSINSQYGINIQNTGTYNITVAGTINGGTGASAFGILNANLATVNITGNIINNVTAANNVNLSLENTSAGTINVTGTITAGSLQHTARNNITGIFRCTRAKGNGYGAGSTGINNVQALLSNAQGSLTYIEELEFGSLGNTPVSGPIRFTSLTSNKVIFTTTTGSFKTLVDTTATAGIVPNASDVRSGTVYNSGNSTGTCAVPSPSSVALNVPVGNTVGTAFLNASDILPAIGLASANLDTQLQAIPNAAQNASAVRIELTNELARVNNCATVATTGQQIENAFQ